MKKSLHEKKRRQLQSKDIEVTRTPMQGKCFEVDPASIDRALFETKRANQRQEIIRRAILKAISEVRAKPERYARPFKTFIPEKTWKTKRVKALIKFAKVNGDHIADWVEQTLEWAQRISNGESWEKLCNAPDTQKYFRLIRCNDNSIRMVGGSIDEEKPCAPVVISKIKLKWYSVLGYSVPLIVIY